MLHLPYQNFASDAEFSPFAHMALLPYLLSCLRITGSLYYRRNLSIFHCRFLFLNKSDAKCSYFAPIRIQNEKCKMQSYNAKFKIDEPAVGRVDSV